MLGDRCSICLEADFDREEIDLDDDFDIDAEERARQRDRDRAAKAFAEASADWRRHGRDDFDRRSKELEFDFDGFEATALRRKWFLERQASPIWRKVRARLSDHYTDSDADEVAADALDRIRRGWSSVTNPTGLVKNAVDSAAIDHHRRRTGPRSGDVVQDDSGRWVHVEESYPTAGADLDDDGDAVDLDAVLGRSGFAAPGPEAVLFESEADFSTVRGALQRLSAPRREALEAQLEGYGVREIAERLGVSVSAVEQRLAGAKAQLRDELTTWAEKNRLLRSGKPKPRLGSTWEGNDCQRGVTRPEVHDAVGCWACTGQDRHLLDGVRASEQDVALAVRPVAEEVGDDR